MLQGRWKILYGIPKTQCSQINEEIIFKKSKQTNPLFPYLCSRKLTNAWKVSLLCFVLSCAVVYYSFSRVQPFATPWTIAHQAPLSVGILSARILEWVAKPASRASSQPRDQSQVSRIAADYLPSEQTGKPIIVWVPQKTEQEGMMFTCLFLR